MRIMTTLALLAAIVGGAAALAIPASATQCWTQCNGWGNSRTCWTNCN